ncbi:MAG TPA: citrate synthase, partial [Polyangia bacterium]
MADRAELKIGNKTVELPVVVGSEGEVGIDVGKLRATTGAVTLDPAYMNTACTSSAITFLDGERGILRYRGIPIEQLAEQATFVEVAYLLIYGHLPNQTELSNFSNLLTRHSMLHEDMKRFFDGYPGAAHPMAILSAMVVSLSSYYPDALNVKNHAEVDITIARLISKLRTIACYSYKRALGQPFVYPKNSLSYCANFLNMMFSVPAEPYEIDEDLVKILNLLLILHADHEQNCSTSTVRMVGSSQANLFAAVAAGILALWGPLHGGANEEVLEMLQEIQAGGGDVKKYVDLAKKKDSGFRLMGFGHRVYKNYDPRAKIIKAAADKVLGKMKTPDPLLDIAHRLEEAALTDPYFIDRKLYPNVDFY